ncbi:MAG: enoyl-CoA hydratase/isomerase family protein [Luteibaculaceae bacterium]
MSLVLTHLSNRIGYITLNRPEKRNAFSPELVRDLKSAFSEYVNAPDCKIIVIKANGPAFSAGADLAYLQTLQQNSYEENLADSLHLMELFKSIYLAPKLVVAQVEGHAIAGGCGLATVCDMVFATPDSKFGYTEVKIGFIPAIVSVFLQRKVGDAIARELLLTGQLYTAEQFKSFKLINQVIDNEQIDLEVTKLVEKLSIETSSQSVAITKQMLAQTFTMPVEAALQFAAEQNAKARATSDCKNGITAFLNKQSIAW